MKYQIVVTYKNGSTILLDVPDNFYHNKYAKKPEAKIHKIFIKEYKSFVLAMGKTENILDVNKYLSFSNATISTKDILGIDLKTVDEIANENANITIPGVHDKTYLDISETSLDTILKKLEETNVIENLDKFIQKVNAMMSKNNVEVTIKAGAKKKPTTTKKPKSETIIESQIETPVVETPIIESVEVVDTENK